MGSFELFIKYPVWRGSWTFGPVVDGPRRAAKVLRMPPVSASSFRAPNLCGGERPHGWEVRYWCVMAYGTGKRAEGATLDLRPPSAVIQG